MAILYTADLHLGHENILSSRCQFNNIEEHDIHILDKWNIKVKNNDDIYILGDLSFRSSHHISYYLANMKGRKHLVVGNHDRSWMKKVTNMSDFFQSVDNLTTIKYDKKHITLCHYPMLEWLGSRCVDVDSSYLIHGHIHGSKNTEVYEYIKRHLPHAFNAGVDVNDFEPVTFEELKENCDKWYGR